MTKLRVARAAVLWVAVVTVGALGGPVGGADVANQSGPQGLPGARPQIAAPAWTALSPPTSPSPAYRYGMAYDPGEKPVFVWVRGDSAAEITAYWNGLKEDATIVQPLGPAGWSPLYGMLKDRFGVTWVLDIAVAYPAP